MFSWGKIVLPEDALLFAGASTVLIDILDVLVVDIDFGYAMGSVDVAEPFDAGARETKFSRCFWECCHANGFLDVVRGERLDPFTGIVNERRRRIVALRALGYPIRRERCRLVGARRSVAAPCLFFLGNGEKSEREEEDEIK